MALYWPEQGVALEIADDEASAKFDRDACPNVTVLETTCEEIADADAFDELAHDLANRLGEDLPEPTPEWREANRRLREALFSCDMWGEDDDPFSDTYDCR